MQLCNKSVERLFLYRFYCNINPHLVQFLHLLVNDDATNKQVI